MRERFSLYQIKMVILKQPPGLLVVVAIRKAKLALVVISTCAKHMGEKGNLALIAVAVGSALGIVIVVNR